MRKQVNKIVLNTTMLMIMNIAKLLFPLLTLPYLTRVLSIECYGAVSYVKTIMTYMQVFVDFGFVLSATKEIVECKNSKEAISSIAGNTAAGKLALCLLGTAILIPVSYIPVLNGFTLYLFTSQIVVLLSCFFFEYVFRGIEAMHMITIRFVFMKSISTVLTFVLVKTDADVLWIPILDIISYSLAAILTIRQLKKLGIKIRIEGFLKIKETLRTSFVYFLSNMASTAFNAANTLLIGIYASAMDVAFWSVCLLLITAVQTVYSPISDGLYPEMIKTKNLKLVKKVLKVFVPIIVTGCVFTIVFSKHVLQIIGGDKYVGATPVLQALTPVLLFSFFTFLLGFPSLGAIGKVKEITFSTVCAAIFQLSCLMLLAITRNFYVIYIAILRSATELLLASLRGVFCFKHKDEFAK